LEAVSFPERTALVRRAVFRLCLRLGWAPLHEVRLANGRRADLLALQPSGGFVCIEVKSGVRDYLADGKWSDYQPYCDQFFFAVDTDFPDEILPVETGLIVCAGLDADVVREPICVPLPPQRRKSMLDRFARLAAERLAALEDPVGAAERMVGLSED